MHASAYLVHSRNGVYHARFVVPIKLNTPGESREFRISTLTKDPRDATSRARLLRVLVEQIWGSNRKPACAGMTQGSRVRHSRAGGNPVQSRFGVESPWGYFCAFFFSF